MSHTTKPTKTRGRWIWITLVVILALIVATGVAASAAYLNAQNQSTTASSTSNNETDSSPKDESSSGKQEGKNDGEPELSDELKATLDATYVTTQVICAAIVKNTGGTVTDEAYTLYLNALLGTPPKLWSDGLSTPLSGSTDEERFLWLKRAICEEPVIGGSFAHLLANLDLVYENQAINSDGSNWLTPWRVDDSKINDLVSTYLPNLTVSDPTNKQMMSDYQANLAYQVFASKLVFILSRYELAGTFNIQSMVNYHLVDGGLSGMAVPGQMVIPEIEVNDAQENLPALTFYLTEKDVCKPLSVLAFNLGDKRPELGEIPADCESLTPPPPSSGCKSDCGWTPPSCPPNMPYGHWPICKDSPSNDPSYNGHNKPGGNGVASPVTGGPTPPAGGNPTPTYTPPAAPSPTGTPDPAPAPTPETTVPPPSTCSPAPGKPC